jgi:hypothetical protein
VSLEIGGSETSLARMAPRLCVVAALATVASAILTGNSVFSSGLNPNSALCFAVCLLALGVLADPAGDSRTGGGAPSRFFSRIKAVATWSLSLAVIAAAGLCAFFLRPGEYQDALSLGGGVFAASFGLSALLRFLRVRCGDGVRAKRIVVCALGVLGVAPLWGAPAAATAPSGFSSLLLSLSPITHLAVLVERDYLRTQWFYTHSQLGSLELGYPSPTLVIAAYLAMGFLCLALSSRSMERHAVPMDPR